MSTRSLLINYNDCPSSIDSLIPDNGLANLAGSLLRHGHKTEILDYATIDTLRDFRPKHVKRKLSAAFLRYKIESAVSGKMSTSTYRYFKEIDQDIAVCRQKKIESIIYKINEKIRREKIDFIAFKLWSGEGFLGSVKIAQALRSVHPGLKIYAGGPHVEIYGERIFSHTNAFDALCQCEGEEIIVHLADTVEGKKNLEEVPGMIFKEGNTIKSTPIQFIEDLNSLPEPAYDEHTYPALKGDEKIKIAMIDETRGCPYSCNFCIHRIKSGNRWRLRDVNKVIYTIKRISNNLNTTAFKFAGSNTPYFYRKELAERLIATDTKIIYVGFADTRQPEREDYTLLRQSGCVSLFFGVESADPYLLEHVLNKKTNPEWIRESLIRAKDAGILTAASILVPCPGETKESVNNTIKLLSETKPHGVSVYPSICYPKTRWHKESERFGFQLDENMEDKMMTYTIKFTMPPPLLDPLPFKIDNKDFYTMVEEVVKTSKRLEKKGIATSMNDTLLLIGKMLHMSPKYMKSFNQKSIILGECEKLQRKIKEFNSSVRRQ